MVNWKWWLRHNGCNVRVEHRKQLSYTIPLLYTTIQGPYTSIPLSQTLLVTDNVRIKMWRHAIARLSRRLPWISICEQIASIRCVIWCTPLNMSPRASIKEQDRKKKYSIFCLEGHIDTDIDIDSRDTLLLSFAGCSTKPRFQLRPDGVIWCFVRGVLRLVFSHIKGSEDDGVLVPVPLHNRICLSLPHYAHDW